MWAYLCEIFGFDQGCSHDWEELESISHERLRNRIASEIAGRNLPATGEYGQRFHHRVCLKCRAVDDQIAAASRMIEHDIRNKMQRQILARTISEDHRPRA